MKEHLFVYGTLLPQRAARGLPAILNQLNRLGPATMPGRLFDLGDYPGAVIDPAAHSHVHGEVFELPDDGRIMAMLDAYEEYDPRNPQRSLYRRERHEATLLEPAPKSNGIRIPCWVYVYNQDPRGSPVILDGRYRYKDHDRDGP